MRDGHEVTVRFPAPEDPKPPTGRASHPFFLYDMIKSQPFAVAATIRSVTDLSRDVVRPPADRPLLFVGLGTSFHAAVAVARSANQSLGARPVAAAIDAFELLLSPGIVESAGGAVVFSSSGETAVTIEAQRALRAAAVPQTLITGTPKSRSVELADQVVLTQQATELSWVHTVSYTTAVVAAVTLVARWGGSVIPDSDRVRRALEEVVGQEPEWRRLATELRSRAKFVCLGSGAGEATAREAALKLREGAGRFVTVVGIEEFLHGVLPSVDPSTAVVAFASSEAEALRASTALTAAEHAGASGVLWSRGGPRDQGTRRYHLPDPGPLVGPVVDIVPVQFLTYWLAVDAGRNPDVMGLDDPRILAARRTYGI